MTRHLRLVGREPKEGDGFLPFAEPHEQDAPRAPGQSASRPQDPFEQLWADIEAANDRLEAVVRRLRG